MPRDDTFQRIVDGEEIALRDAYRRYAAAAQALAARIIGAELADDVVESAFLQIWSEPGRWASEALDVHVLRLTRDLALAARRRGIAPGLAAQDLEPFPIAPDPSLPDIVHDVPADALQRALLRLPGEQSRLLEDAWLDGVAPPEPLGDALDALAAAVSGPLALRGGAADDGDLSGFFLGLTVSVDQDRAVREIRSDRSLAERTSAWPTAIAAITPAALAIERGPPSARMEQRLIQRARITRPPIVRERRLLQTAQRTLIWVALVGLIALAAVFGSIAFSPDDPISGGAVALSEDGRTGVLLPHYEQRLFALVFWGLPEPAGGEQWQLWLVRESGVVEPGPALERSDEGRAAVTVDPNVLDAADRVIGFAVSLDDPASREAGTASSDDIVYQFSR